MLYRCASSPTPPPTSQSSAPPEPDSLGRHPSDCFLSRHAVGLPLPTNTFTFGVEAVYTVGIPCGTEVDVPFEVEYAGPAPTLVAGVSQINFRISLYASYGAIYLHMGSTFSPGFEIHMAVNKILACASA